MDKVITESPIPLYIQIKNDIEKQIHANIIMPGDKLPSQQELCDLYKVSRITVRQALSELQKEGLITGSRGKGSYVTQFKIGLESIIPFEQPLLNKGLKPFTNYLGFKTIPNTYFISKTLNIHISQDISELTLLGLGNDIPFSHYTCYFEYALGLKMQDICLKLIDEGKSFTTFDLYKHLPEIKVGNTYQTLVASSADSYISKILQIKKGTPVMIAESVIYSDEGKPLEYKIAVYRGDKYQFSVIRKPF